MWQIAIPWTYVALQLKGNYHTFRVVSYQLFREEEEKEGAREKTAVARKMRQS